jgi:hypothetical protein
MLPKLLLKIFQGDFPIGAPVIGIAIMAAHVAVPEPDKKVPLPHMDAFPLNGREDLDDPRFVLHGELLG